MKTTQRCDGVSRRDLMRVGGLTALGLGLGSFLRQRQALAAVDATSPRAEACILIWLDGGPSHLESFDPKPDAPAEVRGPMSSIATNVPGIRLGECLPQTASMMDRIAIVRSMTSPLGEHNFGTHYLMTGYKPSPALEYPAYGATLAHLRPTGEVLPPNMAVPKFAKDLSGSGFLPSGTRPFSVGGNPAKPDFQVRDLDFYRGLDLPRLDRRRRIVETLDAFGRAHDASFDHVPDQQLQRAYDLIASPQAKRAFDLTQETSQTRQRYGINPGNSIGQSCLLARRLIERGVPFVTVNNSGWDTHQNILQLKERYPNDRNAHLPSLDRALSALIDDLFQRGRLEKTLVIVMGEFGRTPKINPGGGRDHWPNVFSVALAGGGVRGGQVVGSSDALAEFPRDNPVSPSDLAATIYTLLGIDPAAQLHTDDGRPVRVAPDGARVLTELLT
ncbi:DUF1501 domain-containing protein [Roseiconus nitratireducens]|uniref:DUF1501 domain-containing protein n=1 Tax=Roseiconus nitratireducens TaxID=2605748 RepID=A0A5M6D799_9BACT|nr:DUF1501 domain-containing protein [Roseiconus nitratireducens]KAA5541075.1 DUF1501 domain-containing protein [Roseiconus nitratireducens]